MDITKQKKIYITLGIYSIILAVFTISRSIAIGRIGPLYLAWNIFLAWLPLLWAHLLSRSYTQESPKIFVSILFVVWLLFLPNAFYILTDFVHLYEQQYLPVWYDIAEIFSYTIIGFLLGFLSLVVVEETLGKMYSPRHARQIAIATLILSSVGVSIGRFLRWNTWDVAVYPGAFVRNMVRVVTSESGLALLGGSVVLFSLVFIGFYHIFRVLTDETCNKK